VTSLAQRLESIDEFEREAVPAGSLQGLRRFLGLYASEHVAGTEFVIGTLFVAHGAAAADLLLGLLVGNLLAVLSWAFICAPIATRTRLTLYWKLRKVTGPKLLIAYNLVNALMFCFLAGAMISVAATAVGIPFAMAMPGLDDYYPTSIGWVMTVAIVGVAVTVVATLGFERITQLGKLASPWLFLVFLACAFSVLPRLGVASAADFWRAAEERIWTGVPAEGRVRFSFAHIVFFAWFANMAMHIGLADMTILRYARKWQYGFASAVGMYLGHFVAWISSGVLVAVAMSERGDVAPGAIAYLGAGEAGLLAVVIAGWTTANPTIYRAGLAVQTVTPSWPRWKVTAAVGLVTTIVAMFPGLMMRLFDFVALYGLLLMPMGAVLFADFWLLERLGLRADFAARAGIAIHWPAALAWGATLAVCALLHSVWDVEIFFLGLPGWFIAVAIYVAASLAAQRNASAHSLEAASPGSAPESSR